MPVIYDATTRTTRMGAVLSAIDSGSGAGKIKILSAADVLLVTIPLAAAPSGAVSGDVLTFGSMPRSGTGAAAGTAAKAIYTNGSDATKVSGLTVGIAGSGANVILDNLSVAVGQTVNITSATLTHNTAG